MAEKGLRNGMPVGEFVSSAEKILSTSQTLTEDIRPIIERELKRAKEQSPFSTLNIAYDANGTAHFMWEINTAVDPNNL